MDEVLTTVKGSIFLASLVYLHLNANAEVSKGAPA